MHLHNTPEFAAARQQYDEAMVAYSQFPDSGPDAKAREDEALATLNRADSAFFDAPAFTPFEIAAKLKAIGERGGGKDFCVTDFYPLEAMREDLGRLQRCEISPRMRTAFETFRAHEIAWQEEPLLDDDPDYQKHVDLYLALLRTPCTTAGDFILKQYASLRCERGGMDTPRLRKDGTANMWDIEIDDLDDEATFSQAEAATLYEDIDGTDIGMNLLAYGQPHFDPSLWLDAADRADLSVSIYRRADGGWSFGITYAAEFSDARHQRDHHRLQRILASPAAREDRYRMVGDLIRATRPELVHDCAAAELTAEGVAS